MKTGNIYGTKSIKIALLADVHANLPALEAVLADAREQEAQHFWNLGDCVGYGAFPSESVRLLQETCQLHVLGNYDAKVLMVSRNLEKWIRNKHPLKAEAFQWAWDHLTPEQRIWMAGLPLMVRTEMGGVRILLRHTLAVSRAEVQDPVAGLRRWRKLSKEAQDAGGADLVLGGHLHPPLEHDKKLRFCVVGAVGRPVDGDPRAHYTLLKLKDGKISIKHRRVAYDHAQAAAAIRRQRQPEAFAVMVSRGVDLAGAEEIIQQDGAEVGEHITKGE